MLGKLLKYEMKASARTLLPLYIGTLIVAAICSIQIFMLFADSEEGLWVENPIIGDTPFSVFSFMLFFALCVAIMVLTAMIVIQRFNKSLIGDEGYLMFTLPVTHTQLLSSKLIAGLLWVVIGTIVMGLSAVLIWTPGFMTAADINWAEFWNQLQIVNSRFNTDWLWDLALMMVDGIVRVITVILTVYLSIMIGQMEQCSKYRVAVSVVMFFVINWLFSFIGLSFLNAWDLAMNVEAGQAYYHFMGTDIALKLMQCVVCFAGVVWTMKKKLNL